MAVTYRQSGVDIDEADSLIERIKPMAKKTRTPFVISDVGGFAGLCGLPKGMEEPVLVSGTDGVGTKLKVAFALKRHDTIGIDLVAMCINDIITCGADPLFFLDYFATGKLSADVGAQVVSGIAEGCQLAECALLGGETAELPGMYADGEYDLAGFAVGVADRKNLLGPERVREGDAILAVASSGLHSNGYSLARRVVEQEMKLQLDQVVPELGGTVGDALLRPTKIYVKAVKALKQTTGTDLHALCHVTGGGSVENLPRILPEGLSCRLERNRPWSPLFSMIARGGPVELHEMRRTFNLGVGLFVLVSEHQAEAGLAALRAAGEDAYRVGTVVKGPRSVIYEGDPEELRA